jgi:predicted RNase H-like HicB family nuclease
MNLESTIEKTGNGYSAYVRGLPGCVAAAATREEVQQLINEAIEFHLEGLMLRKSLVALAPIRLRSTTALVWTTENTPTLFVGIEAPFSTLAGTVVPPKIDFGEVVAAA